MFLLCLELREAEEMGGIRVVGEIISLNIGKNSKGVEVLKKMEMWVVEVESSSPNKLFMVLPRLCCVVVYALWSREEEDES